MSDPNLPEDIHNFDNDPRSPFYDDGGYEGFIDDRVSELMTDCSGELDPNIDELLDCIFDCIHDDNFKEQVTTFLIATAEKQAKEEWENERAY